MNWVIEATLRKLAEREALLRYGDEPWLVKTPDGTFHLNDDMVEEMLADRLILIQKSKRIVFGSSIRVERMVANERTYIALALIGKSISIAAFDLLESIERSSRTGNPYEWVDLVDRAEAKELLKAHLFYYSKTDEDGRRYARITYEGRGLVVDVGTYAVDLQIGAKTL